MAAPTAVDHRAVDHRAVDHRAAARAAIVAAAAEARRRKQRRRVVGFWIRIGAMLLLIATVVVLSFGFNNSWWVQKHPVASSDQLASDGSSVFSQAGIDFFTRQGVVEVTMTSPRPGATELGLAATGTKHIDFLVPLTIKAVGAQTVALADVEGLDLITSGGKLSAIEIRPTGSYPQLLGQVSALAPSVGWSDGAVAQFRATLIAGQEESHRTSYTATIGPAATTGMRVSATLSADQESAPTLVIRLDAAR